MTDLERNKQVVVDRVRREPAEGDRRSFRPALRPAQHGPEAFTEFVNWLPQEFADHIGDAGRELARVEWLADRGDLRRLIGGPTTPVADVIADLVRANAA